MQESNDAKLKAAIKAAVLGNRDMSDSDVAASVAQAAPDVMWAWALERLAVLVRAERRKEPDPNQLLLPFTDLSLRVPVKDGFVRLREATIGKLRTWATDLQRKRVAFAKSDAPRSTMLGRIQQLIEGMHPYSASNRRLTVEGYYELVASGTPPPEYTDRMSPAMKRYWDQMSPEQRSAIARKKAKKRWAKKAKAGK